MNNKIIFILSVVFLALFILVSTVVNSIAAPLVAYTPEALINVEMHRLDASGGRLIPQRVCLQGDTNWGCTTFCDNLDVCAQGAHYYPYATNPSDVNIQTDYLLDVVASEMNPAIYPAAGDAAFQAQAIAARSYIWHKQENWEPSGYQITNSNQDQVFIPYKFDALAPFATPLSVTVNPCTLTTLNTAQQKICDAVASRHYLALDGYDIPALAEFSSDIAVMTISGDKDYLKSVQEPITQNNICDGNTDLNNAHGRGMSQEGAVRWSRGNQCASDNFGNQPWNVQWDHPDQILFHYYTDVHLRDADDNTIVSPYYRWNPLQITWNTPSSCPPEMSSGSSCTVTIQIQNTGVYPWSCASQRTFKLGVLWQGPLTPVRVPADPNGWPSVCGLQPGQSEHYTFSFPAPPSSESGKYQLHFDVVETLNYSQENWFGEMGWYSYEIPVCVNNGACYFAYIPRVSSSTTRAPYP
jgi:hypothetical protein